MMSNKHLEIRIAFELSPFVQPNFRNGVTNGASWYPITGGMKDFSYQYTGTMEVVVEVSDCKYPHRSKVKWDDFT